MKKFVLAIACTVFLLTASPAGALKISPFKASLPAENPSASEVFRVENNTDAPAAVQVSVMTWQLAEDGSETNSPAEDEFVVFPAQLVLKPHESRAVRVQYTGSLPAAEKAYRLVAEQLPVDLADTPPAGSAVRFMLKFNAALYVTPPAAKPQVTVVSAEPQANGMLKLLLDNKGTAHAIINKPRLTVKAKGVDTILTDDALQSLAGENMHAGARRIFFVPLPAGSPLRGVSGSLPATLDFEAGF